MLLSVEGALASALVPMSRRYLRSTYGSGGCAACNGVGHEQTSAVIRDAGAVYEAALIRGRLVRMPEDTEHRSRMASNR